MHGNVWEWVQDVWYAGIEGAPTDGSAWLESPDKHNRGITRGGSFLNPPWLLRSYVRMRPPPRLPNPLQQRLRNRNVP